LSDFPEHNAVLRDGSCYAHGQEGTLNDGVEPGTYVCDVCLRIYELKEVGRVVI
jgi:hypothetical protein